MLKSGKKKPCQFLWEKNTWMLTGAQDSEDIAENAREIRLQYQQRDSFIGFLQSSRIRKMEETGVIKEYTIIVDERKREMRYADGSQPGASKFFDSCRR